MSNIDNNEEVAEAPVTITPEQQLAYGDIFHQLMQKERFQLFMGCNYEIIFHTKPSLNDEPGEVDRIAVLELSPEEATQKYNNLAKKPDGVTDIQIATPEQVKKLKL